MNPKAYQHALKLYENGAISAQRLYQTSRWYYANVGSGIGFIATSICQECGYFMQSDSGLVIDRTCYECRVKYPCADELNRDFDLLDPDEIVRQKVDQDEDELFPSRNTRHWLTGG